MNKPLFLLLLSKYAISLTNKKSEQGQELGSFDFEVPDLLMSHDNTKLYLLGGRVGGGGGGGVYSISLATAY